MNGGSNGKELPVSNASSGNKHDNKQTINDEEGSNYSNVAAKTVANIRRLQENVMSVSVTTSPSGGPLSPKDTNPNDLLLQDKNEPKHPNNVSKISINRPNTSNMSVQSDNPESAVSRNAFQNANEVLSLGNDPSASSASLSMGTSHLGNDLSCISNTNVLSQASMSKYVITLDASLRMW